MELFIADQTEDQRNYSVAQGNPKKEGQTWTVNMNVYNSSIFCTVTSCCDSVEEVKSYSTLNGSWEEQESRHEASCVFNCILRPWHQAILLLRSIALRKWNWMAPACCSVARIEAQLFHLDFFSLSTRWKIGQFLN